MNTAGQVRAVLFDRDGTLVHDVPYNGDPARVRPVDGAREAVALLRARGVRVGVVTNQSGVARGLISATDVQRVNRRIDDLVGPFDVWAICPHGPDDGCHCRKPRPGLVLWAAGRLCTDPADCAVVGDIGADTEAAARAGAHGILVPNARTRPEETEAAAHTAPDLLTAVRSLLDGPPGGGSSDGGRPDGGLSGDGSSGVDRSRIGCTPRTGPSGDGSSRTGPFGGVWSRVGPAGDGSSPAGPSRDGSSGGGWSRTRPSGDGWSRTGPFGGVWSRVGPAGDPSSTAGPARDRLSPVGPSPDGSSPAGPHEGRVRVGGCPAAAAPVPTGEAPDPCRRSS
ncbi:D-glycero-alpha-D-manno-heptose-1,7-bisphosphate 7-phosphatase [Streptomyces mayonensis]|uniref:D-glycero-alpha-D-manno-heptose-1,7-bisphosphate 7-phosphatase n=1 Tax=Streptomyces mayonensis TaxID=2750816 RepID=UPI0035AB97BA